MSRIKMSGARFPLLVQGVFYLEIADTHTSDRKGTFVAEFKVIHSSTPAVQVGEMRAWLQGTGDLDIALPSIKSFLVCASGFMSEDEAYQKGCDIAALTDAAQNNKDRLILPNGQPNPYGPNPLKGRIIGVSVDAPGTRNKPLSKFQRHNWQPVVGR